VENLKSEAAAVSSTDTRALRPVAHIAIEEAERSRVLELARCREVTEAEERRLELREKGCRRQGGEGPGANK
jgi:hypothetical protein